ncbi:hypothetical protein [Candidatus Similichlamydia laticola]|uniref:Uncharacterized protein n=1 Tax=Candidatus Similichlamydia laticola TaxID=2170265 RepID=A0A369KDQ7_9BACT|nr:hypothetical protein [Candidatus Similichlamydia laticola]RDB31590.1 hypothetical protein HAT2_00303 [Candidatus Similichlamydia laticola]
MVPFWFRFSRSLFLTRPSCLVTLSLGVSLFLSTLVHSLAEGVGKKWFRALSLSFPPLLVQVPYSSQEEFACVLDKIGSVKLFPFRREAVSCFSLSSSVCHDALIINKSFQLGSLKEGELLVPKSWTHTQIGDVLSLQFLESGKRVEGCVTGFFSDFPGLTDDLILAEWPGALPSCVFACFPPLYQIQPFKKLLREKLPPTCSLSSLDEHPVYGDWIQSLFYDYFLVSCLIGAILCLGLVNTFLCTFLLLLQKKKEIALIRIMGGSYQKVLVSFLSWVGICFLCSFSIAFASCFFILEWVMKRSTSATQWIGSLLGLPEVSIGDLLQEIQLIPLSSKTLMLFLFIVGLGVCLPVFFFCRRSPEELLRSDR